MYESIKKIILVDIPLLDFYPKLAISCTIASISMFLMISIWRSPSRVSLIDPITDGRIREGVQNFFAHSDRFSPEIPVVFGNAKDIVRRMKDEKDIFAKVQTEIEARKRNDVNWTFANQLSHAYALVNALGLNPDTPKENQIFLQMPLPIVTGDTSLVQK